MQYPQTVPARPALLILPSDAAVQLVDSAYQIVTMIGANPRAIRPILAQRRLTKEQVLEAAVDAIERAEASLGELDAVTRERQAMHDVTVQELRERLAAWGVETEPGALQLDDAPAEVAHLQTELETADAEFARFQAEQRRPRVFLTGLCERAAEVQRVYSLL
jgi:hypothetical protein